MLTQKLENKSMDAAEVAQNINSSLQSPPLDIESLRLELAQLRADENRIEKELHQAKGALTDAETGINDAMYSASKGNQTRENLTQMMFSQAAAQNRILNAVEALRTTRERLRQSNEALLDAEARLAARETAECEREIVEELRSLAVDMASYSQRCQRVRVLRERAREMNGHLFGPGVLESLYTNWGEIISVDAVESRLALIAKVCELPQAAAEFIYPRLREKSRAFKAEQDRAERHAREHAEFKKSGPKPLILDEFQMTYVENVGLVTTRSAEWDRGR